MVLQAVQKQMRHIRSLQHRPPHKGKDALEVRNHQIECASITHPMALDGGELGCKFEAEHTQKQQRTGMLLAMPRTPWCATYFAVPMIDAPTMPAEQSAEGTAA